MSRHSWCLGAQGVVKAVPFLRWEQGVECVDGGLRLSASGDGWWGCGGENPQAAANRVLLEEAARAYFSRQLSPRPPRRRLPFDQRQELAPCASGGELEALTNEVCRGWLPEHEGRGHEARRVRWR